MADANTVLGELTNGEPVIIHEGNPGLKFSTKSVRKAVFAAAFELTFWLKRRGLKTLLAARGNADTALGHSIASASFGEINHALLVAIATKVGVDTKAVLAPYQDDPK